MEWKVKLDRRYTIIDQNLDTRLDVRLKVLAFHEPGSPDSLDQVFTRPRVQLFATCKLHDQLFHAFGAQFLILSLSNLR